VNYSWVNIYMWHNWTFRRRQRLSKWSSLDYGFVQGQGRNPCKWDSEGTGADWPQGWCRPSWALMLMGALEIWGIPAPALGILGGRAAGTPWRPRMPRSPVQAGCIRLAVCMLWSQPAGMQQMSLILLPVFLPRIYTTDTWQPEEVCVCMCTGWALSDQ